MLLSNINCNMQHYTLFALNHIGYIFSTVFFSSSIIVFSLFHSHLSLSYSDFLHLFISDFCMSIISLNSLITIKFTCNIFRSIASWNIYSPTLCASSKVSSSLLPLILVADMVVIKSWSSSSWCWCSAPSSLWSLPVCGCWSSWSILQCHALLCPCLPLAWRGRALTKEALRITWLAFCFYFSCWCVESPINKSLFGLSLCKLSRL